MPKTWGLVAVMVLCGACADQSASTQQRATTPSEPQGSAVDANAMTPERQDAIERAFQRKAGSLQQCWADEYEKTHDRKMEDDVTIGMDITPAGTPSNVRVLKSSANNRDIEACVTKEIQGWEFPDGHATVPYMRTVHLGAQF